MDVHVCKEVYLYSCINICVLVRHVISDVSNHKLILLVHQREFYDARKVNHKMNPRNYMKTYVNILEYSNSN